MEGCFPKCVKAILIITNNLVILMGVVVFGFGIFALSDGKDLAKLVDWGSQVTGSDLRVALYSTASVVLIIASILAIVVASIGCCGAIKENRCMLFTYYILLLILFMGVTVGATIALSQSLYIIRSPLKDSMRLYNPDSTNPKDIDATQAWNDIQEAYSCCGVDTYADWSSVNGTIFPKGDQKVPASCCKSFAADEPTPAANVTSDAGNYKDCLKNPQDPKYSNVMDGCLDTLTKDLEYSRKSIGIATGAVIAFMFINLVTLFAFAMYLNPRDGYHRI